MMLRAILLRDVGKFTAREVRAMCYYAKIAGRSGMPVYRRRRPAAEKRRAA